MYANVNVSAFGILCSYRKWTKMLKNRIRNKNAQMGSDIVCNRGKTKDAQYE